MDTKIEDDFIRNDKGILYIVEDTEKIKNIKSQFKKWNPEENPFYNRDHAIGMHLDKSGVLLLEDMIPARISGFDYNNNPTSNVYNGISKYYPMNSVEVEKVVLSENPKLIRKLRIQKAMYKK